ncbi:MAG: patatin-like phospholipase family protein, partial [Pseudomonadota bacterium]
MREGDRTAINTAETEEVNKRRSRVAGQALPPDTPVTNATGLAFSGGGIRSASFCLGVAQVLAEHSLLGKFDIMSSVSGGGYTASFLARRLADGQERDVAAPDGPDTLPIRDVRQKASYLDTGHLSQTLPRVVRLLAGMILNWSVPAALVAVLTILVYLFNTGATAPWADWLWSKDLWVSAACAGLGLLVYSWMPRSWSGLRNVLLWVLWGAAGFLFACWIVEIAYTTDSLPFLKTTDLQELTIGGLIAAGAAALPLASRVVPMLAKPWARKLGNVLVLALAFVAIPFLGLIFAFWLYELAGLSAVEVPLIGYEVDGFRLVVIGTAFLFLTAVWRVDINWTGPHWLYRDSLGETFVKLPDLKPEDKAKAVNKGEYRDNIPISELDPEGKAPYLLMNAVVNLPSSKLPGLHKRKGDFFLLSSRFCGSPVTEYAETKKWMSAGKEVDLSTAVATSGAAVAPQMALLNIAAARALLSFLNVRLGFWVKHPDKSTIIPGSTPGAVALLREMFAWFMNEHNAWMMLTDGAHLENSGVYELLRRRCRFIVAVDASADPGGKFETLITLARHARIDLGVEITPPIDELRTNAETGLSPAHGILCDITYPPCMVRGEKQKAVMLYIKTAITGNEEELVNAYHRANPDFPNQSTADQFFDEHQFEAYRQLGVHSAKSMLDEVLIGPGDPPQTVPEWLRRLYARIPPVASEDRVSE